MKKKLAFLVTILLSLGVFYSFGTAGKDYGKVVIANPQWENLQILPQDISEDDLKHVMRSFNASLGLKCSFCHVRGDEPETMNWASDANDHKEVAREMMRMTMSINEQYFGEKNPANFKVNCFTCHNGAKYPEVIPPADEKERPAGEVQPEKKQ